MGGLGSGRQNAQHRKKTVEDSLILDIKKSGITSGIKHMGKNRLISGTSKWIRQRDNKVIAGIGFEIERVEEDTMLTLNYDVTRNADSTTVRYQIRLANTPTPFGGLRWWFICPGDDCESRAAKLYFKAGSDYFLCRECHGLTYKSCQESHRYDRLYRDIAKMTSISPKMVEQSLKRF